MTMDKAAQIISYEINSRAKLNQADSHLQMKEKKEIFVEKIKNYLSNQLEIILKKITGYETMLIIFLVQITLVPHIL